MTTPYTEQGWTIVLIAVIMHIFQVILNVGAISVMLHVYGARRIFTDGMLEAILCLMLSDLCFAFPGLIFTIPALAANDQDILTDQCFAMGVFTSFAAFFSIGAMLVLALNRFIVIFLGRKPSLNFAIFLKVVGLPFIVGGMTVAISWPQEFTLKGSGTICWPTWSAPRMYSLSLIFGILLMLSFVAVVFLYGAVIYKIRETIRDTKRFFSAEALTGTTDSKSKQDLFRDELETAQKIAYILVLAITGWLVLDISIMHGAVNGGRLPVYAEDAAHYLNALMGCLNPLLIIWLNTPMRRFVISYVRRFQRQ